MTKALKSILILFIAVYSAIAQDAKIILQYSNDKCKAIQSGTYEMITRWKPLTSKDTVTNILTTDFVKINNDSLSPAKLEIIGKKFSSLYTGNELIKSNPSDSTATILSNKLYADEIQYSVRTSNLFTPFINPEKFFETNLFSDRNVVYSFIGKEKQLDRICHKISVKIPDDTSHSSNPTPINYTITIWVDSNSFLPVRFDKDLDLIMNNDTMHQYNSYELIKYDLNKSFSDNYFSLDSIPKFYKLKDYVPYKQLDLLSEKTSPPDWKLNSLDNKEYSLKDFSGKVLLIDFFYKACYPCMKALPVLQSLQDKYKDKGLAVVGIDPYDKKEDDLPSFLSKRGVTYTVLLAGKEVPNNYKVSGYPTIYLIDKNGKIIFSQVGYSEEMHEKLENMIKENLK